MPKTTPNEPGLKSGLGLAHERMFGKQDLDPFLAAPASLLLTTSPWELPDEAYLARSLATIPANMVCAEGAARGSGGTPDADAPRANACHGESSAPVHGSQVNSSTCAPVSLCLVTCSV